MTKAVIFDTDGMVVITDMFSVQYCKDFNVPYDIMLPFFKNEFHQCLVGKADLKEKIAPYLAGWKWKGSVDEFLKYWFDTENHVDKDIVDVIYKLKNHGIKCFLATKQEKYRTEYLKNEMGFNKLFDRIYSSSDVGYSKDDKEFYDFIVNDTAIDKSEIQFWDDTERLVLVAKEYGLDAHHYVGCDDFIQVLKKSGINIK